jgi:lipoprotein NlpI
MADLAARRSGTREVELLSRSASHALPGSWDEAGLNFLLGKITEEKLIDGTRRDSEFEMLQRQCEAYYWLAQVALGEQRRDDAVQWLQRCMNTGFAAYLEYWLARDELQRLAPEKVKDRGPQESDWTITT